MSALHRARNGKHNAFKFIRRRRKPRWTRALPLKCPDCGEQTYAYNSREGPGGVWEKSRVCPSNHRWAWDRRNRPRRRIETQKPRGRWCIFPGCKSKTEAEAYGTGMTTLCAAHAKQKERDGWANLRPYERRRHDGICPRCETRPRPENKSGGGRFAYCLPCRREYDRGRKRRRRESTW